MIQKLSCNIQILWMMFIITLTITIKIEIVKTLIVFDDMIPDVNINSKFQSAVNELFIRCRKLNISLASITQSYFPVSELDSST